MPIDSVDVQSLVKTAQKYGIYGKTNMKPGDKLYRAMCIQTKHKDEFEASLNTKKLDRITSFSPLTIVRIFHDCSYAEKIKKSLQYLIILTLKDPKTEIFSDSITIEHPHGLYLGDPGFEVQVMPGIHDMKWINYTDADANISLFDK